jgi:hypothetical protein
MEKNKSKQINLKANFNRSKIGIWGTLGGGGKCEVNFIQTILTGDDIDNVKRISDIPESQKWKIKDLFQRNVNMHRVEEGIIPYLNDTEKIKFFNPLTLIILPHDEKNRIIKNVPQLESEDFKDSLNLDYTGLTLKGFYRFGKSDDPYFGKLEWSSNNCYLVAIDGQHRLSALKSIKENPDNTFSDWKVPAVILVVHKLENLKTPDLIEVVRSVFIDINDKAEKLSKARKILLNDTLPVDVLCQELIEFSHNTVNEEALPLNFFDWRGDTDDFEIPVTPIVSVIELNSWLTSYFDFSSDEKNFKLPEWLVHLGLSKGNLDYKSCERLRAKINEEFVPAMHLFFSQLDYIKNYFGLLEKEFQGIEGNYIREREKYGMPQGNYDNKKEKKYEEFKSKFKKENGFKQNSLPKWLAMDLGLRALVYCYSQRDVFNELYKIAYGSKATLYNWNTHAEYSSNILNEVIAGGWFGKTEDLTKEQEKLLLNLVYSGNNTTINYRLDDVEKGLGALILRMCIKLSGVDESKQAIVDKISNLSESLQDTYKKDLRKEVKANLRATYIGSAVELDSEIKKETEKKVKQKLKILNDVLENYKSKIPSNRTKKSIKKN